MKLPSFLICSLLLISLMFSGCATPPATIAYKTESAADIAVISAMSGWGAYVAASHPGVATELKVKAAFEKTQAAEIALIDATSAWVRLSPAAGGSTAPPDVIAAQAAFSQATASLVTLVQSFGITLK